MKIAVWIIAACAVIATTYYVVIPSALVVADAQVVLAAPSDFDAAVTRDLEERRACGERGISTPSGCKAR